MPCPMVSKIRAQRERGQVKAKILNGKEIAAKLRAELSEQVKHLKTEGIHPCLAVVLVGDDPSSVIYVRMKDRAASQTGICARTLRFPADITQAALVTEIEKLNQNQQVHGILVQLPLPAHINANQVIETINPNKDVDGLHPCNAGKLAMGVPHLVPCTPAGIMVLLEHTGLNLTGQKAVVVGRSNLVGKPAAALMLSRNATVTTCHSRTRDLAGEIARADVVVAAVGQPNLIKGEWIKDGAVVIDVGITRQADGTICGDVEFDKASVRASWITPVPGGVGPMTVAMLLDNTVKAATTQQGRQTSLNP